MPANHAMHLPVISMMLLMGLLASCAELDSDPPVDAGPDGSTFPVVAVACTNNRNEETGIENWELEVSTTPVESGKPFTATLRGIALFDENFLDIMQDLFPGGVEEINLVDLKATVHVREGATGEDVVLEPEENDYQCGDSFGPPCDHANDLPSVPGRVGNVGNTDCQDPEGPTNPCGRFIRLPISTECEPDGICDEHRKLGPPTFQCERNRFCITGGLRLPLQAQTREYTAGAQGEVLFGWDDQSTGATIQQGGEYDGTWILPPAVYEEPIASIGARVTVRNIPAALECTMGVDSGLTTPSQLLISSPTPNEALIKIP